MKTKSQKGVLIITCYPESIPVGLTAFLIFVALLLGGCAVGPDFKNPEAPVPEKWLDHEQDKVVNEQTPDYSSWWTVFDDSVLTALIEKAYNQNLNLQIAGLRILEARAQLGIAAGEQYPQSQALTGGAIYNNLSKNGANLASADRRFWDFKVGFDAAWELDFWGRFRRGVESAQAGLGATLTNYDDILVSLTAEVATVYNRLRTLEQRLHIARENVKIQQRSYEIADIRFKNGAVTELDPMQALSLLRNTEASVPQLQTLIKQSKYAISTLLGMPPSNLENILTGTSQIPVPPSKITLGIPAELLRRRPDVRLAELRAAAQSANIGIAKSELFPRFILLGSIGFESSDKGSFSASNGAHLNDLFNGSSFTWFVGPSVNWNILNYGRIKNDVRVQDARFQELIVDYQDAVLNAAREVEHGVVGFIGKQEEVVFLQSAVKAAKHSVDLAQIQYRDGAVDYIRVLDTQQNLFSQQDRLTSNKGQINNNLIAIYKAMGGGWELRKGHSFVPVNIRQEMRERTDWGDFMTEETMPEDQPEAPPAASDQSLFPSIGFW